MPDKELYDLDFFEWTRVNAELLRRGSLEQADIEHIAGELEDMGKRDLRELSSRLMRILEHKLKLDLTVGQIHDRNQAGWNSAILRQQAAIELLLQQSPSLEPGLSKAVQEAYRKAVRIVAAEFPVNPDRECRWSVKQVLGREKE